MAKKEADEKMEKDEREEEKRRGVKKAEKNCKSKELEKTVFYLKIQQLKSHDTLTTY